MEAAAAAWFAVDDPSAACWTGAGATGMLAGSEVPTELDDGTDDAVGADWESFPMFRRNWARA